MAEEDIIRLLPKLLREHPELRHEVAMILSESLADKGDIAAILDHLERLRADFNRKVEEDNKRFEGIITEIKTLREQFNKKVEEDNKRFEGIITEIKTLREQFNKLASEVFGLKRRVSTLEENFGAFIESYYVSRVVEVLEKRLGSTAFKVLKNVTVEGGELDALIITDGTVYTLEVSGVLRKKDVSKLKRSSDRLTAMSEYKAKQVKPIAAGVRVDSHAVELAKRLNVEIMYI
ncbi:MAG: hypothetical protein QW514_06535 [Thermoprotei archaeon]